MTLRESFNRANPGELADLFRSIKLGDLLEGQLPQQLNGAVPAANAGNLATVLAVAPPDHAKGCQVIRAFARAGGVTGPLVVVAPDATPGSGEIAVAPNGNLVTLAADAITSLDVNYNPMRGDVYEAVFPVVAHKIVLPTTIAGRLPITILEANALEGTATGVKIVVAPAAAPAAGQVAFDTVAKNAIEFNAGDVVTRARIKLLMAPVAALQTVLEGADLVV